VKRKKKKGRMWLRKDDHVFQGERKEMKRKEKYKNNHRKKKEEN
jgi:hypothetical protein